VLGFSNFVRTSQRGRPHPLRLSEAGDHDGQGPEEVPQGDPAEQGFPAPCEQLGQGYRAEVL
ncbi:MAG: hypothetical protein JKY03_14490, partial [Aureispira sp.]|nr:hypothetical protein [Aureispira sp.]